MRVSVVIAARNEEDIIEKTVRAQLDQDFQDKEVIVVDDFSTDGTLSKLKKFGDKIKVVRHERNLGFGGAVSSGIRASRGEFVVVVQADFAPIGNKWLHDLLEPFADKSVSVVMSQRVVEQGKLSLGERLFDVVAPQSVLNKSGKLEEHLYSRLKCDAVRREVFEEFGFFDVKASGDDVYFSLEAVLKGHKIVLSPKAKALSLFSFRQRDLKGCLKKSLQYGWPAYLLHKKYGYDGLHTRAFLFCLSLLFLAPLLFFKGFWSELLFFGLFLASFFLWVGFRRVGKVPFGLIPLLLVGLFFVNYQLYLLNTSSFGLGDCYGLDRAGCYPSFAFWFFESAGFGLLMVASAALFVGWYGLVGCYRYLKKGYSAALLPFVFFFVCLWRLGTGYGYLKGWWDSRKTERVPTW